LDNAADNALQIVEGLRGGGKYRYPWGLIRDHVEKLALRCQAYSIYQFQVDKVWRARKQNAENCFASIDELGPPEKVDQYGRCHTPASPVFYCAGRSDVALAELDAELEQHYALSCFEIEDPLVAIAIGEFDYFWRTGECYFRRLMSRDIEDYKKLNEREDAHVLRAIDAFFADEFLKPACAARDYRLTSAIADVLFNWKCQHEIDALVYPSVAFREGLNFAITPRAFKEKLKLLKNETHVRKINDVCGFGIYGSYERFRLTSVSAAGSLSWQNIDSQ
jgi:hypothetical protein